MSVPQTVLQSGRKKNAYKKAKTIENINPAVFKYLTALGSTFLKRSDAWLKNFGIKKY